MHTTAMPIGGSVAHTQRFGAPSLSLRRSESM